MPEPVRGGLEQSAGDGRNVGSEREPGDFCSQVEIPSRGALALEEGEHQDSAGARIDCSGHLEKLTEIPSGDGRPPVHDGAVGGHGSADDRHTGDVACHTELGEVSMIRRRDGDAEPTGLAAGIEAASGGVDGSRPRRHVGVVGPRDQRDSFR